jgi:hypothetical protein
LLDEPRPGRPRSVNDDQVEQVVVTILEETPPDAMHWSTRSLAARTGMSQSAVSRIWHAFGLKPHKPDTFKISKDPLFVKVRDVVGLYLGSPERGPGAVRGREVTDPGLDRSAPMLPMLPGVPARQSFDYVRHGTTSLFAALGLASGTVISSLKLLPGRRTMVASLPNEAASPSAVVSGRPHFGRWVSELDGPLNAIRKAHDNRQ